MLLEKKFAKAFDICDLGVIAGVVLSGRGSGYSPSRFYVPPSPVYIELCSPLFFTD